VLCITVLLTTKNRGGLSEKKQKIVYKTMQGGDDKI